MNRYRIRLEENNQYTPDIVYTGHLIIEADCSYDSGVFHLTLLKEGFPNIRDKYELSGNYYQRIHKVTYSVDDVCNILGPTIWETLNLLNKIPASDEDAERTILRIILRDKKNVDIISEHFPEWSKWYQEMYSEERMRQS